jgi:hypothetical protein
LNHAAGDLAFVTDSFFVKPRLLGFTQNNPLQQIGAVAFRLSQRRTASPLRDLGVITAE